MYVDVLLRGRSSVTSITLLPNFLQMIKKYRAGDKFTSAINFDTNIQIDDM